MTRPRWQDDERVITETRPVEKTRKAPLYRVILHNDDFTTMEFVVAVLRAIFHHSEAEATVLMLQIHRSGRGVAGIYTREVAETKVVEVTRAAEVAEYPLLCTMEPDGSPGDE